jgi:hypothetical protein
MSSKNVRRIGYVLDDPEIRFLSSHRVQTSFRAHPAYYLMVLRDLCPRLKWQEHGAVSSLRCMSMAWCLIKERENINNYMKIDW